MYPGPVHWSPSTYDGEGANDVCMQFIQAGPLTSLSGDFVTPKVTNLLSLVQRIPGDCDLYTCVLCEYLWKRLVVRCFCFNPLFTEPECPIAMQLFTLNSTTASMYMYEVLKEFLMNQKILDNLQTTWNIDKTSQDGNFCYSARQEQTGKCCTGNLKYFN